MHSCTDTQKQAGVQVGQQGRPLLTCDLLQRAMQEVSVRWPPRLKWVQGRGGTSMGIALTPRSCEQRAGEERGVLQNGRDRRFGTKYIKTPQQLVPTCHVPLNNSLEGRLCHPDDPGHMGPRGGGVVLAGSGVVRLAVREHLVDKGWFHHCCLRRQEWRGRTRHRA